MTNRQLMIDILSGNGPDDGGSEEESVIFYNIGCPYMYGDKRALCNDNEGGVIIRDQCVECKSTWLDKEVDQ